MLFTGKKKPLRGKLVTMHGKASPSRMGGNSKVYGSRRAATAAKRTQRGRVADPLTRIHSRSL